MVRSLALLMWCAALLTGCDTTIGRYSVDCHIYRTRADSNGLIGVVNYHYAGNDYRRANEIRESCL